jgi:hypothetical protein
MAGILANRPANLILNAYCKLKYALIPDNVLAVATAVRINPMTRLIRLAPASFTNRCIKVAISMQK